MLSVRGAAGRRSVRRWKARAIAPPFQAIMLFVGVRLLVLATLLVAAGQQGKAGYGLLTKWDAQWYAGIAENGYGFVRLHDDGRLLADYAFFPLFPLLERAVAATTGLNAVAAGVALSAAGSVVAAAGIFAIASHLFGPRTGVIATGLWAALPIGIVQSMAYSEALFTAIAAWSLYAILIERWLLAGILACAAGLTRPLGAAVIAALLAAVVAQRLRANRQEQRMPYSHSMRPLVAVAIAPLGLFGYLAWVGWQVGSPTGYFDVANAWGNGFDGGVAFGSWVGTLLTGPRPVTGLLLITGLALLVWGVLLCVKQGQPVALVAFVVALVVLALTTSGYFGSKPRYLLPAFPLLFPVAQWLAQRRPSAALAALAAATAVAATYGSIWLLGPGPP